MKIKDILREADTILNVDPSKGLVTYGDATTGISHTVPQTMLQQNQDGSVVVNTQAVNATTDPNKAAQAQAQFKTGAQVKSSTTGSGATMGSNTSTAPAGLGEEHDDHDVRQLSDDEYNRIAQLAKKHGIRLTGLGANADGSINWEGVDSHGRRQHGVLQSDFAEDTDLVSNDHNQDVGGPEGGDATDDFVHDVVVKPEVKGSYYETQQPNTFGAKDELAHWLSIAGIK